MYLFNSSKTIVIIESFFFAGYRPGSIHQLRDGTEVVLQFL